MVAGRVTEEAAPVDTPATAAALRTTVVRRRLLGASGLVLLALAAAAASVALGAKPLPPSALWHALLTPTGTEGDVIVRSLRLPRTGLGVVVGTALGVAGALMQGHTRNPLAGPGVLGVSAGAALGVVTGIYAFDISSLYGYVWLAFFGALVASALVFLLGSLGGSGTTPLTLVLAGAAVSATLGGVTGALVLLDAQTLDAYRFWAVGALAGRPPVIAGQVLPFVGAGLVLAAMNAPGLNAMAMGEDVARALGVRIGPTRVLGLVAITLLTGAAVAACGPIGFVGLVVPHLGRALVGPDHRWLLLYSGLLGAILVLVADVVGRVAPGGGELPVGIVLALVGAPFFVALVRRERLVRL